MEERLSPILSHCNWSARTCYEALLEYATMHVGELNSGTKVNNGYEVKDGAITLSVSITIPVALTGDKGTDGVSIANEAIDDLGRQMWTELQSQIGCAKDAIEVTLKKPA